MDRMSRDRKEPLTDVRQQRAIILPLLSSPAGYVPAASKVELIETHISWVFLTDHRVYKLKKAIDLGFVDYRDPALRRAMCDEEVRLNRRLTDEVYLGVMPITQAADGVLALAGAGEPVEWVVTMRRLAAADAADQRLAHGDLLPDHVERIAERLVDFYRKCVPAALSAGDYRPHFEKRIRDNLAVLADKKRDLDATLVERVHGRQLQYLSLARAEIYARAEGMRIVDGHGDLRPEHIFLSRGPHGIRCDVIDCVEFSAELRMVDVADELAFLAMEFHRMGAVWVGQQIRRDYERRNGDPIPDALFDFYQSYRACVRAKVAVLRGDQVDEELLQEHRRQAKEYLELADQLSERFRRPIVLVVSGLSGTGKSTLAGAVARHLHAAWLRTDVIRKVMFGGAERPAAPDEGVYRPDARAAVYARMMDLAGESLGAGRSVVLDGTFLESRQVSLANALAQDHGATAILVRCACPPDVALARIRRRSAAGESLSDADEQVYRRQAAVLQKQSPEPGKSTTSMASAMPALDVDSTRPVEVQVEAVLQFAIAAA